jgi:hypothetical protein
VWYLSSKDTTPTLMQLARNRDSLSESGISAIAHRHARPTMGHEPCDSHERGSAMLVGIADPDI